MLREAVCCGKARTYCLSNLPCCRAQIQVTDANGTWTARAGTARADGSAPVPQAGLFRAGSATKMFTAVVLMQLVGEGKVLLDTPLERYVSTELVPAAERITVRMLGPDSRYGLGLKQERLSCGRLAVARPAAYRLRDACLHDT